MSLRELLVELWGLISRFVPWPAPTGLHSIGDPGPDAPVLLCGNYRVALGRLRRALRGHDVWLLVANSHGINVWCAAAGGHLTDHEVIAALRSSGVADKVSHRDLILPQLSATGVQPRLLEERTGWCARFGPVRADDLPAFLARGSTTRTMRTVRFGLLARLEMGGVWGLPVGTLCLVVGWLVAGLGAGLLCAAAALITAGVLFTALPLLPAQGRARFLAGLGAALLFFTIAGGGFTLLAGPSAGAALAWAGVGLLLGMLFVVDLAGSTPTLGADSVHPERFAVEVLAERCCGDGECVRVCPSNVLEVHDGLARLARPERCIRCGACLVQCPEDALRFRFHDGAVVEAATVRRTKLNLLGKRAVALRPDEPT